MGVSAFRTVQDRGSQISVGLLPSLIARRLVFAEAGR